MKPCVKRVIVLVAIAAPMLANADAPIPGWSFSVAPYVWLPSVNGELKYGPPPSGGSSANVKIDSSALMENLEMAMMINAQARNGRWLIATDYMYLNLGKVDSSVKSVDFNPGAGPINISTGELDRGSETSLKGSVWSLVGGYALLSERSVNLDMFGGFRHIGLEASTDWNLSTTVNGPAGSQTFARNGSVKKTQNIATAIIGAKGRVNLGDSEWFVPYYLDLGGNGSTFTWQASAGLGYAFKWGDVRVDYRNLSYDQRDDAFIEKLNLGGFSVGANFRF